LGAKGDARAEREPNEALRCGRCDAEANAPGFAAKAPGPGPASHSTLPKRFALLLNTEEQPLTRLLGESGFGSPSYAPGPGVLIFDAANRPLLLEKAEDGRVPVEAKVEGTLESSSLRGVDEPLAPPRGTSSGRLRGACACCHGRLREEPPPNEAPRGVARFAASAAMPVLASGL